MTALLAVILGMQIKLHPSRMKNNRFCLDDNVQNLNEVEVIGRRKAIQMSHGGFIINMDVINKMGNCFLTYCHKYP